MSFFRHQCELVLRHHHQMQVSNYFVKFFYSAHSLGGEGGLGSIVRKTPDTALYSIYVSTLWLFLYPLPPSPWYVCVGKEKG